MKFTPGSDQLERWKQVTKKYNPSLVKEINRIRSLYQKALLKKGEKLACMEYFAVIAVHSPKSITKKGNEFVACRCNVEWTGDDYEVNPITVIFRKKKKKRKIKEVIQVVKKKKKVQITKKVRKKKKRIIVI